MTELYCGFQLTKQSEFETTVFRKFGAPSQLVLATAAVGEDYFRKWRQFSFPNWTSYAERHGYQVIALTEPLVPPDTHAGWNKFAMIEPLMREVDETATLVILDADQIFSPVASPLLPSLHATKVGVVPEEYGRHQKLLSYLRKRFVSEDYPLDSAILLEPHNRPKNGALSELSGLKFYSAGLVAVPPAMRIELIEFAERGRIDSSSLFDGGGDQMPFIRFLGERSVHEIEQEWQGIWPNILATRYPFIYRDRNQQVAADVLASALLSFNLIHFSTTWPEKDFWHIDFMKAWKALFPADAEPQFEKYLLEAITPKEYGQIAPPSHSFFD